MTNMSLSLDWLRFTLPDGALDDGERAPSFVGGETNECKPVLSYNTAVMNEFHSLHWHTDHPEFRVMVEMTGQQLSKLRKAGTTESGLISKAIELGAKFTRIDFAVDLFDTGGRPVDVLQCWRHDQFYTIAKSVSLVSKETRKSTTGETVYIGSRSSERLVRVYDKAQQQKTKTDWLRVELEAKGKRADQLGRLMQSDGVDKSGLAMLADVCEWSDIDWFENIWGSEYEPFEIDSIGRPETDRERWLRTVVVPVITEELEAGSAWLFDALAAVMQQTVDRQGHGPHLTIPHKT